MRLLLAPAPGWAVSTTLLLVRLVMGVAFILHGWPKVQKATSWMSSMPDPPPGFLQAIAAIFEVAGGALLALGLFTRAAALAIAAVMVGALALVHIPKGDPFVSPGGPSSELASVYLAVSLLIAAVGAGAYSLDAIVFRRR
jgi:putative oxidoreductase